MVATILNNDNNQISRLNVEQNGDVQRIALGEENERNIVSCLQYLLDRDDLIGSEIAERLATEYNYACIVHKSESLLGFGGMTYSVSRWKIQDERKDINVKYTIYIVWDIHE